MAHSRYLALKPQLLRASSILTYPNDDEAALFVPLVNYELKITQSVKNNSYLFSSKTIYSARLISSTVYDYLKGAHINNPKGITALTTCGKVIDSLQDHH